MTAGPSPFEGRPGDLSNSRCRGLSHLVPFSDPQGHASSCARWGRGQHRRSPRPELLRAAPAVVGSEEEGPAEGGGVGPHPALGGVTLLGRPPTPQLWALWAGVETGWLRSERQLARVGAGQHNATAGSAVLNTGVLDPQQRPPHTGWQAGTRAPQPRPRHARPAAERGARQSRCLPGTRRQHLAVL